jgi:arylsulfatase A-like enzyme
VIRSSEEPFFLFTNLMEAHGPHHAIRGYDRDLYSVSNTWSSRRLDIWDIIDTDDPDAGRVAVERWRDLYGASIDYLDRRLVRFIDRVQSTTDRETTFVITADHGENLGYEADEHLLDHTSSLSEGLLHVPLVVVNPPPSWEPSGDGYVSHLDLGRILVGLAHDDPPTDIFRQRVPAEVIGISKSAFEDDPDKYAYYDRMLRCAYDYETAIKLVWDSLGDSDRYALDHDRLCWQEKVASDVGLPDWATAFFDDDIEAAKRAVREADEEREMTDETRQQLERLGYL